ncbi:MAG: transcriptional regulator, TrmB [Candidatus Saccharibacteria bacterium]|nr:transcriptional regulator, TrmB [Candidatus Saccharibacteria bacterium]
MKDDNTTFLALLSQLGLREAEAETYKALLELEAVSIRKVADVTGINRGTTYEIIKRLVTIGLANVRQSGQREYYSAESPEKIYHLIQEKRKDLWHAQQLAKEVIPELMAEKARPQGRPLVRYYEDDEGIVTILKDVLQTCALMENPEYYVYSSRPLRQYMYRKFPQFTQRRIDEGINVKVIAVGEGGNKVDASERKWLPEPTKAGISSYVLIYGNKVANISISNDYTPYGVVIEDAGVASMQRLLFEQLWGVI